MANNNCVCDYCKYRHSWDCDDGIPYPRGGYEDFSLDFAMLNRKQQKAIQRILSNNDYDRPYRRFDWED